MIIDYRLKRKLRYSYPFQNVNVPNERQSSNSCRVAALFSNSALLNSGVTGPMFTKFSHDV